MRYGCLRRGSCHGAGLGGVVPRDANALCEQEEHAAPRETKEACAQAVEDRRHGLFELLYRHGDGYSDCALQPPDHAIPRLGRARDLRRQRPQVGLVLRRTSARTRSRSTAPSATSAHSSSAARTASDRHPSPSFRRISARGKRLASARRCDMRCGRSYFSAFSGRCRAWRARISTSAFL